jgi:hypothetical protein
MNSLLHQLENNEAILLMYLANELPAQDRDEVEHMLERDGHLRLEFAQIQQAYTGYHGIMRQADASTPPTSPFTAAHAVGDVLRSRRPEMPSVDDHEEHRRLHWVAYPIAAAAALAIGMFLWWQSARDDLMKPQPVMVTDGGYDHRWSGRWGGGQWGPPPGMQGIDMDDLQILRAFEPVIRDPGSEAQRQVAAIRFLDESLQ